MSIANGIEIDPWSVFAERLDVPSGSAELTINASNTSWKQGDAVECDIIRTDSQKTLPELWLSKRPLNDNHWRWLCDVGDILETEYEVDYGENWLDSVSVHLRFISLEASLRLFRSEQFPRAAPRIESTLNGSFTFEWNEESSLLAVCNTFSDLCNLLDYAIVECSELNYPFKFIDWQLKLEDGAEEGDEECLLINVDYAKSENGGMKLKEIRLTFLIDWHVPSSFPRSIKCDDQNFLKSIQFQNWDPLLTFAENLRNLFAQDETEGGVNVMNLIDYNLSSNH